MSEYADYLLAKKLEERWNAGNGDDESDIEEVNFKPPPVSKKPMEVKRSNPHSNLDEEFLNRTQNLVHPLWESLDPTPDTKALFNAFDMKFFQERLKCVTLEWSKRMYSCAGICYSRRNRFGMDITIRLSEPLLKLRPRKDLIETLLHEMIHAYCFVLNIKEGNGGHGPNFKKIMYGINKVAGTNITVYHTFHDEVNLYKQHWWRCNGMCQHRTPFFGYVKRTSNRAPGPNDQWWGAHLESCGGTFMKIKEPEKKKKAATTSKTKETATGSGDLRKFFNPNKVSNITKPSSGQSTINGFGSDTNTGFKGPIKINGGGTMLLNPKTNSIAKALPPTSYPGLSTDPFNIHYSPNSNIFNERKKSGKSLAATGGNLRNVMSFGDLMGRTMSDIKTPSSNNTMSGRGFSLSSTSGTGTNTPRRDDGDINRNHLREIWTKRFGGDNKSTIHKKDNKDETQDDDEICDGDAKRRRLEDDLESAKNVKKWVVVDEDIMFKDQEVETIQIFSDNDSDGDDTASHLPAPRSKAKPMTTDERQTVIKQEILDETTGLNDEDIILIDDDYNDEEALSTAAELADTSVIDEFFGEDTLLKDFKRENDVVPCGSRFVLNPANDIITCPICQEKMQRYILEEHLNGCTGIAVKIKAPTHALKKLHSTPNKANPTRRSRSSSERTRDILRSAGYTERDLLNISNDSSADETITVESSPPNIDSSPDIDENTRRYRQRNLFKTTRQCPVCAQEIEENIINEHLDDCLKKRKN